MEIIRRHVASQPTRLAAYLALECALMRRYLARGGTLEDFCARLAPIFHQRFAPVILGDQAEPALQQALPTCTPRLRQECRHAGAR